MLNAVRSGNNLHAQIGSCQQESIKSQIQREDWLRRYVSIAACCIKGVI